MSEKAQTYLKKCMDECGDKLSDPSFFADDSPQCNALRVENMRDMSPRCGHKLPEHWNEAAKKRGWGRWIYSGGSASVFGHCVYSDCPLKEFFLRHAPLKSIRDLADAGGTAE